MIAQRLSGGSRRQTGAVEEVISFVLRDTAKFDELFEAMLHEEAIVRMRASEAVEKLSRNRPDLLTPHRARLIDEVGEIDQPEVRRHVAQMLSVLSLNPKEKSRATALLERYLHDKSVMVVTASLETLVDFSQKDRHLRKRVTPILERMIARGTPAMKVRAKKLYDRLAKQDTGKTATSLPKNRRVPRPKP